MTALLSNLTWGLLRIPRVPFGPAALWVEPVNYCNLKCDGCWVPAKQARGPRNKMDLRFFEAQIESVQDTLLLLILQMSGEPFLHESLFEMIRVASARGISVWTSTNGSFRTPEDWGVRVVESGLDTLVFSRLGGDAETYRSTTSRAT